MWYINLINIKLKSIISFTEKLSEWQTFLKLLLILKRDKTLWLGKIVSIKLLLKSYCLVYSA